MSHKCFVRSKLEKKFLFFEKVLTKKGMTIIKEKKSAKVFKKKKKKCGLRRFVNGIIFTQCYFVQSLLRKQT